MGWNDGGFVGGLVDGGLVDGGGLVGGNGFRASEEGGEGESFLRGDGEGGTGDFGGEGVALLMGGEEVGNVGLGIDSDEGGDDVGFLIVVGGLDLGRTGADE